MLLLVLAARLAAAAEPVWTLDLGESPVPFLSDSGVLLLATDTEVLGVDTSDGAIRWRRPQVESVRGDLFQPVPWTDFVLLSTHTLGPDTYELIDARTGETAWTARPGDAVLGVWPAPDASWGFVLTFHPDEPGLALSAVALAPDGLAWRVDDALRDSPVFGPTRSGRTSAVTARDAPLPTFDGDAVITWWSPYDGFARRGGDGEVAWRLLLPGGERLLPIDGFADPVLADGTLWFPSRLDRVAGLDVATGALRWRAGAGKVRGTVDHVAPVGDLVVVAGGDALDALDTARGKRVWAQRLPSAVRDVAVAGDIVAVVGTDGVIRGFGADGTPRFAVPVAEEPGPVTLDAVDGALVARYARGVTVVDPATGALAWRRETEGALPEPSTWGVGADDRGAELFREPAPVSHPSTGEHVWIVLERVDGRSSAVLHRADVRTGEVTSVALGSKTPRWMWDARTGIAVEFGREGRIEGFRPALP